jgi:hypothetical protein
MSDFTRMLVLPMMTREAGFLVFGMMPRLVFMRFLLSLEAYRCSGRAG